MGTSKNSSFKSGIQNAVTSSSKINPIQPIPFSQRGANLSQARARGQDPLVDKMGNPIKGITPVRQAVTGVSRLGRPLTKGLSGGKATATATVPGRKASKNKQVDIQNPTTPNTPHRATQGLLGKFGDEGSTKGTPFFNQVPTRGDQKKAIIEQHGSDVADMLYK